MDIFVASQAFVRNDQIDVIGVALDGIVTRDLDTAGFELAFKGMCLLIGVAPTGDHNVADVEPVFAEHIDVAEDVIFVGDSQVFTHLAALEVQGVNGNDNFGLVSKLGQHDDLVIGGEAGEHAGSVHIVNKLAAKLKIKGSSELLTPLCNMLGLKGQILIAVETDCVHDRHSLGIEFWGLLMVSPLTLNSHWSTPEPR